MLQSVGGLALCMSFYTSHVGGIVANSFFFLGFSRTSNRCRSNSRDSSIKIPQSFARSSGLYASVLREILKAFLRSFSRRRNLSLYKRRCVAAFYDF